MIERGVARRLPAVVRPHQPFGSAPTSVVWWAASTIEMKDRCVTLTHVGDGRRPEPAGPVDWPTTRCGQQLDLTAELRGVLPDAGEGMIGCSVASLRLRHAFCKLAGARPQQRNAIMSQSRYKRLDRHDSIDDMVRDIVDRQAEGSATGTSFAAADVAAFDRRSRNASQGAYGTRIDDPLQRRDTELSRNVANQARAAVVMEALEALRTDAVGDREQQDMIRLLTSMRADLDWL